MKAATPIVSSLSSLPLFVYGTLLSPVVMESLIQRRVIGRPAQLLSSSLSTTAASIDAATSAKILQGNENLGYEYGRHPVHGEVYPGLVHWTADNIDESIQNNIPRSHICGILYINLTENEMSSLDEFEGDQYRKELCFVQLQSNDNNVDGMIYGRDEIIQAMVYIWSNPLSDLDLSSDWSYSTFEREHLATYL